MVQCTYIFGSSAKCFPVANIRIIGLDPLDLLSTYERGFVLHEKWGTSLNIFNAKGEKISNRIDIWKIFFFFFYFMNWLYADGTRCLFSGAEMENNSS
jgi:hypothetical protein